MISSLSMHDYTPTKEIIEQALGSNPIQPPGKVKGTLNVGRRNTRDTM